VVVVVVGVSRKSIHSILSTTIEATENGSISAPYFKHDYLGINSTPLIYYWSYLRTATVQYYCYYLLLLLLLPPLLLLPQLTTVPNQEELN